jgi:hypothetical protein
MLVYPIPTAVTQARVQLVADQTEKAPPHVIQADVINVGSPGQRRPRGQEGLSGIA